MLLYLILAINLQQRVPKPQFPALPAASPSISILQFMTQNQRDKELISRHAATKRRVKADVYAFGEECFPSHTSILPCERREEIGFITH